MSLCNGYHYERYVGREVTEVTGRGAHFAARRLGPSGKSVTSRGRRAGHCCGGGVPLFDTDQARPGSSGNNVASGGRRAGHRQGGGVPLLDNDPGG